MTPRHNYPPPPTPRWLDPQRIAAKLADLPALTVSVIDNVFTDDATVRITQDLGDPRGLLHHFTPIPGHLVADMGADITVLEDHIAMLAGAQFRPWLRPDPPAIPPLVLFPRLHALTHRRRRTRHGITRKTFL